MDRLLLFCIFFFLCCASFLPAQEFNPSNDHEADKSRFPYTEKREWRILPNKSVTGYLSSFPYIKANWSYNYGQIGLTDEKRESKANFRSDLIHPEDLAWIEFARDEVRLDRDSKYSPTDDEVEIPVAPGDRVLFPTVDIEELGVESSESTILHLASHALWWDATGFLLAAKGDDLGEKAEWAFKEAERSVGKSAEGGWDLVEVWKSFQEFLRRAYDREMGAAWVTVPYVDAKILHHYAQSDDILLLHTKISVGRDLKYDGVCSVISADEGGNVELFYQGVRMHAQLATVGADEEVRDLVPGTKELVLTNRAEAPEWVRDDECRFFIRPAGRRPLWVFRPYRMKVPTEADATLPYLIPPPEVKGDREGEVPGMTVTSEAEASQKEEIAFKRSLFPKHYRFVTGTTLSTRTWTNRQGKTLEGKFTGKIDRPPGSSSQRASITFASGTTPVDLGELSAIDCTYVRFALSDTGAQAGVGSGRILYKVRTPNDPTPSWMEVRFNGNNTTAIMMRGDSFTRPAGQQSVESLVEAGYSVFRIDWKSLSFQRLTPSLAEVPIGSIDKEVLAINGDPFKPSGTDPKMYTPALPVNHDGLPVRALTLPKSPQSYEMKFVFSRLGIPWITGFWKVFCLNSESRIAKTMDPAENTIIATYDLGAVPVEILYKNREIPEQSFQLRMEEVDLTSPGPEPFSLGDG